MDPPFVGRRLWLRRTAAARDRSGELHGATVEGGSSTWHVGDDFFLGERTMSVVETMYERGMGLGLDGVIKSGIIWILWDNMEVSCG